MNPVYIGKIRYNVRQNWSEKRRRDINPNPVLVDGIHEAIIDMDTWNRVQERLQNGKGMAISRVTKKKADGSKKVLSYYACGAWKNKGTVACKSNMIRIERYMNMSLGSYRNCLRMKRW